MTSQPDPSVGVAVRRLMRSGARAALGTLEADGGARYVSLAMVALDHDASPLLLLSDLADHTRNLKADPRASLLFDGTARREVPLAGERATVQGRAERVEDPRLLARYVARHPDAEAYAGFGDFNLYRLDVERAHLVAGFGRISWVPGEAVLCDAARDARALAEAEARIVRRVNEDHADAVRLCAQRLLGREGDGWCVTGVDPEGADLRRGSGGGEVARLWFDAPARDAEEARVGLARLAERARRAGNA